MNSKVTLIIPVRKETAFLGRCLRAVHAGTEVPQVIVMDCTADPQALRGARERFPQVRFFDFGMNPGRAHAVNTGFHITQTPYVMTLSPRLLVGKHCIGRLLAAMEEEADAMSAQALILSAEDSGRVSGAGWLLDLSADPVTRGAGTGAGKYKKRARVIAAQMDAAIYRMGYLEVTGILDERFYTRLEDLDLGCRAITAGFKNICEPAALCKEMAAAPRSRFYEQLELGNMEYLRYKHGLKGIKAPESGADREDPLQKAALDRGRMLCFQAEIEQMERQELGMSVTSLTLPDEFCMEIQEDGPRGVYPLYVGCRTEESPLQMPDLLRLRAGMLAGTAERVRNRIIRRS